MRTLFECPSCGERVLVITERAEVQHRCPLKRREWVVFDKPGGK